MAITTPQAFNEKHNPTATRLDDAEIERRINAALQAAKSGTAAIYVDVGGGTARHNPNTERAREMAAAAGWAVSIDGRTGRLILEPK